MVLKSDLGGGIGWVIHSRPPFLTRRSEIDKVFALAVIAQLVEHVHGKDGVPGSIPGDGSS